MAVQGLRVARRGAEYIGTMEVQEKHRFDERSLARFMATHVEGFVPPVKAEQFKGGQSNPTYRLTDGAGRRLIEVPTREGRSLNVTPILATQTLAEIADRVARDRTNAARERTSTHEAQRPSH